MPIPKSGNILLFEDMVICDGLDFKTASKLLSKANKSNVAKKLTFFINSFPEMNGYRLMARDTQMTREFIKDPESFIIRLED